MIDWIINYTALWGNREWGAIVICVMSTILILIGMYNSFLDSQNKRKINDAIRKRNKSHFK